jgi:hypothetical protein
VSICHPCDLEGILTRTLHRLIRYGRRRSTPPPFTLFIQLPSSPPSSSSRRCHIPATARHPRRPAPLPPSGAGGVGSRRSPTPSALSPRSRLPIRPPPPTISSVVVPPPDHGPTAGLHPLGRRHPRRPASRHLCRASLPPLTLPLGLTVTAAPSPPPKNPEP